MTITLEAGCPKGDGPCHPAPRMRVLLVSANREMLPQPVVPIGVLSVASALRGEHEVRVADLCFEDEPAAALREVVRGARPDVVGFGIRNLHTNAYDGTERLIEGYRALVEVLRGETAAPVVLGGAGFSLRPETLLARLGADHGVVGEGERAFGRLVGGLARGEPMPRIVRGATANGETVAIGTSAAKGELDRLPAPAKDLVDPRYYAYDGTDAIQTKRGCAFACAYCDYPDLEGRKVRVRDPEAVAEDVVARSRVPGVTHAFFVRQRVQRAAVARARALRRARGARGAAALGLLRVARVAGRRGRGRDGTRGVRGRRDRHRRRDRGVAAAAEQAVRARRRRRGARGVRAQPDR